MNNYKYTLSNFQAIKDANIKLDGITVLAGENGSGKSTLSRWIYYLINTINQYDSLVVNSFVRRKSRDISNMLRVMNIEFAKRPFIDADDLYEINDIELISTIYRKVYADFLDNVIPWIKDVNITKSRKRRLLSHFNILYSDDLNDSEENIINFYNSKIDEFDKELRLLSITRNNQNKKTLFGFIKDMYDEDVDLMPEIQLYEQDNALLDKEDFHYIYQLKRAIYIDTPMALGHKDYRSRAWTNLQDMMIKEYKEKAEGADRIIFNISRITGGNFTVKTDILGSKEIHFEHRNGLDIELEKAATGLNAFAYLQLLLKNGYLDDETLLLIDEPEAHLHPQWIVEFARILVNIHKVLGVKIMIASHNPDMVSAIQSIARKEGVEDFTNFYLAVKDNNSFQYQYKWLGTDISEIFRSFNIALSRIKEYGE